MSEVGGMISLRISKQVLHLAFQEVVRGALLSISFGFAMNRKQSIFASTTNAEVDHLASSHPVAISYSSENWE